jgi:Xaa-Pro aminopeptidase
VSQATVSGEAPGERRAARLQRVRARMAEMDVQALLLSHGADLPWLTGYRAMPLERLTLLVLPLEGEPVLFVPALEAPRVPDLPGEIALRPWHETEDPLSLAAAALGPGAAARVALSDRAWAVTLLGLQARLVGTSFLAASDVTGALRAVKDPFEIEVLRRAASAADGVAAALQAGEIPLAGRSEREVSREIAERLVEAGHRHVNFSIVGSGPNGASPHHDAGRRVIAPGDVVVCDFGGEWAPADGEVGYCSDITRTVVVGDPPPEVRDCYAVLEAAQAAGVAAARPGAAAEDVDRAARDVISDAGYGDRFIHRTGHGIGIEEHEDPYVVAGNRTPLVEGHAFSVEPGLYFAGRFGMRLEDIVVVGPDGPDALNRADHGLAVVGG